MTYPAEYGGSPPTSRVIASTAEFRRGAAAWDDLWQRSETVVPTARAAAVALWVDHFQPGALFRAVAVEFKGRLVAGLALVGPRPLRGMPVGRLPNNVWASSGDLLLDSDVHPGEVLDVLAGGLAGLPWPALAFDRVAYQNSGWLALMEAMHRAGLSPIVIHQHCAGQVETAQDWQTYYGQLKGRHRIRHRRRAKMLSQAGHAEIRVETGRDGHDVDVMVRRGFDVENRSWKARRGTSVLQSPGMLEFFSEWARDLAAHGHLECAFLELDDQPIAFVYAWRSKGVFACVKIGYDETFSQFGPGQQLVSRLLEKLHGDRDSVLFDFYGPMQDWNAMWATHRYPVGRIVATRPGSVARALGGVYVRARPWVRKLRQGLRRSPAT